MPAAKRKTHQTDTMFFLNIAAHFVDEGTMFALTQLSTLQHAVVLLRTLAVGIKNFKVGRKFATRNKTRVI